MRAVACHASSPRSVFASVFGRRKEAVLLPRNALWDPYGITRFSTAGWEADTRQVAPAMHRLGKRHTQQRARRHLTLCVATSLEMHAMVMGLFVHR